MKEHPVPQFCVYLMFSPSPSGNVDEVVVSQRQEKNKQSPSEGARCYPDL